MWKADKIRLLCYILVVGAALVYPVKKIISFEYPAVPPKVYMFETEIYDPYDPMRGRYVRLNFKQNRIRLPHKNMDMETWRSGKPCYAVLETNPDGTARIADLLTDVKQIPKDKDFLRVKYLYFQWDHEKNAAARQKTGVHVIELPFDRFYLNESLAPEAEREVQKFTRKGKASVKVKVYQNGNFALDDLIVDGTPIRDLLRGKKAK